MNSRLKINATFVILFWTPTIYWFWVYWWIFILSYWILVLNSLRMISSFWFSPGIMNFNRYYLYFICMIVEKINRLLRIENIISFITYEIILSIWVSEKETFRRFPENNPEYTYTFAFLDLVIKEKINLNFIWLL